MHEIGVCVCTVHVWFQFAHVHLLCMQNTQHLLVLSSPACRSISALLPRVTAAMAGALCGQTLPVVVKAQTISCSAGLLLLAPSFTVPLIAVAETGEA